MRRGPWAYRRRGSPASGEGHLWRKRRHQKQPKLDLCVLGFWMLIFPISSQIAQTLHLTISSTLHTQQFNYYYFTFFYIYKLHKTHIEEWANEWIETKNTFKFNFFFEIVDVDGVVRRKLGDRGQFGHFLLVDFLRYRRGSFSKTSELLMLDSRAADSSPFPLSNWAVCIVGRINWAKQVSINLMGWLILSKCHVRLQSQVYILLQSLGFKNIIILDRWAFL